MPAPSRPTAPFSLRLPRLLRRSGRRASVVRAASTSLAGVIASAALLLSAPSADAQPQPTVGTLAGGPFHDGPAATARFFHPTGVAVAADGTVYVADRDNNRIRKISPDGIVSTFAGSGVQGYTDGPGSIARFYHPIGVAVSPTGEIYVADVLNCRIRKISPDEVVSTLAGTGVAGFADGPGATAQFSSVFFVAAGPGGTVYVSDYMNRRIRKITADGTVTTFAGSGASGSADGPAGSAQFTNPENIKIDADGLIYVRDAGRIRRISPDAVVSTLSGTETYSFVPTDAEGRSYIVDMYNHRIRRVTREGVVSGINDSAQWTIDPVGRIVGSANGQGTETLFNSPAGVAVDANGTIYVSDTNNQLIRKITPDGRSSTFAGSGAQGYANGPGASARFNYPRGLAVGTDGTVYVADIGNYRIRKIAPDGMVSTLAGTGVPGLTDGPGATAQFYEPWGLALDADGNVYVGAGAIRKITPDGIVSTIPGIGGKDVVIDSEGVLYCTGGTKIGKRTPDGVVSILAGSDTSGFADGTGSAARFSQLEGITLDALGNLYVADDANGTNSRMSIRKITPDGVVTTLVSTNSSFVVADLVDGPANLAVIGRVSDVAVGADGVIYFPDLTNHAIRTIRPPTAFDYWMATHLSATDLADPVKSAGIVDPDGDGRPNLLEYVLGSSPSLVDADPPGELLPPSAGAWTFRFFRPAGLVGATCTVESSPDLITWTPCPAVVVSTLENTETVEAALPAPAPALFTRLRATLAP